MAAAPVLARKRHGSCWGVEMCRGRLRCSARRAVVAMVAVVSACVAMVLVTGEHNAFVRGGVGSLRGSTRASCTTRRAEAFDPFGWKGSLKDTMQGFLGTLDDDEEPSKVEEVMIAGIFDKFDVDKDEILNIDEFNALQIATEGAEAVYNAEQLKSLLLAVNPDLEDPDRGMPFSDYRRLYVEKRLRQAYGTDVRRDHAKIFGAEGTAKVEATVATAMAQEAAEKSGLVEGAAVSIEGLTGAVELNGKTGHVVAPLADEAEMVAEGRLIIQLQDSSERIALKPANIRVSAEAAQVD